MYVELRILLVEDNQRHATMMVSELMKQGIEVFLARDETSAVMEASRCKPQVIVISNSQDNDHAATLIKNIRLDVHTAATPVLVMLERTVGRATFLAAGAQEVIDKPVGMPTLLESIRRLAVNPLVAKRAPAEAIENTSRIMAVAETGLLDTGPEQTFDLLTRLASTLTGTSVALLSIVDKDRQFFKSQIGLDQPLAQLRQTDLDHSFCQWVVAKSEALLIEDSRTHETLQYNKAVTELGIIAYAGIPLIAQSGMAIGSFCALDSKPKSWNEEDVLTLEDLAKATESFITLRGTLNRKPLNGIAGIARNCAYLHACGAAINALTSVLDRYRSRMPNVLGMELIGLVKQLTQQLNQFAEFHVTNVTR